MSEVQAVQKQADVLVFVESLERRYRNAARLSFSTKITDYLKSGKCIFAIGGSDIAPIDYFKRYDSAVVATCYDEIKGVLEKISVNPDIVKEYSKKAYNCGVQNHTKAKQNEILISAIEGVVR